MLWYCRSWYLYLMLPRHWESSSWNISHLIYYISFSIPNGTNDCTWFLWSIVLLFLKETYLPKNWVVYSLLYIKQWFTLFYYCLDVLHLHVLTLIHLQGCKNSAVCIDNFCFVIVFLPPIQFELRLYGEMIKPLVKKKKKSGSVSKQPFFFLLNISAV